MSTDHIFIKQLTLNAIIGVLDHERVTPQPLVIDLRLETNCITAAAATDSLAQTIDYAAIAQDVETFCVTTKAKLVETLAEGIAAHLLERDAIQGVHISVAKPDALKLAASVGVEIYRCR